MTSSRLPLAVLAIAVSLLAGCATERSDSAPCPPIAAYSRDFLARAADELDSLPAGSAMEQMLADYQVMRDQARCVGDANSDAIRRLTRCKVNRKEHALVSAELGAAGLTLCVLSITWK